jgi:hypothetical protein
MAVEEGMGKRFGAIIGFSQFDWNRPFYLVLENQYLNSHFQYGMKII